MKIACGTGCETAA